MPTGDHGACTRCGGRLTATHMLLRTWPLDARGHWVRRQVDFAEDIVIACAACGHPPVGSVQRCGNRYHFVPGDVADGAGTAPHTVAPCGHGLERRCGGHTERGKP